MIVIETEGSELCLHGSIYFCFTVKLSYVYILMLKIVFIIKIELLNKYRPAVIMFSPSYIMYNLLSVINYLIDIHEPHKGNVNWSGHTLRRNSKKICMR